MVVWVIQGIPQVLPMSPNGVTHVSGPYRPQRAPSLPPEPEGPRAADVAETVRFSQDWLRSWTRSALPGAAIWLAVDSSDLPEPVSHWDDFPTSADEPPNHLAEPASNREDRHNGSPLLQICSEELSCEGDLLPTTNIVRACDCKVMSKNGGEPATHKIYAFLRPERRCPAALASQNTAAVRASPRRFRERKQLIGEK